MLRIIDRNAHENILSSLTDESRNSLYSQIAYLSTYADTTVSVTQLAQCVVCLCPNEKYKEYAVLWERLDSESKSYTFWMNGGLVMDRSGNWSVHT